MRRRILWVAMTSVVLAVTVLGVPLVFALSHLVTNDERNELERLALRAAVTVSPDYQHGDQIELPHAEPEIELAVYDRTGRRVAGQGPATLGPDSRAALTGSVAQADELEHVVETVPVTSGERVIAVVRAASPESAVTARTARWSLALIGGCLVAAVCAGGFAAAQSRRLVRPLAGLAHTAGELGAGDFSVRATPSGVAEIDAAGDSLNRTAERLASLIERERSFSTYASHQLRTPLTQLQLELEYGLEHGDDELRSAAAAAMGTADQLSQTIDDVLEAARGNEQSATFDVGELLNHIESRWRGPLAAQSRPLRVSSDGDLRVAASPSAARQIMQVLMDNALRHGRGTVTVHARESHSAVAIDVIDEGTAAHIDMAENGRLGLALARSLATAEGGRLMIDQHGPGTRFTVLLRAGRSEI